MKRIVIIGATGTGKTTLANQVSNKLALDFVDLDELHWMPGWQVRDAADFKQCVANAVAADGFAVSGNYREVRDIIWARADTVVWLNYPFWFVFCRLLRRSLLRVVDERKVCNGNTETWAKFLSHDSIMVWLFKSYWRRKRGIRAILDNPSAYPHITFLEFKNPKDTQKWLTHISLAPSPSVA